MAFPVHLGLPLRTSPLVRLLSEKKSPRTFLALAADVSHDLCSGALPVRGHPGGAGGKAATQLGARGRMQGPSTSAAVPAEGLPGISSCRAWWDKRAGRGGLQGPAVKAAGGEAAAPARLRDSRQEAEGGSPLRGRQTLLGLRWEGGLSTQEVQRARGAQQREGEGRRGAPVSFASNARLKILSRQTPRS